MPSDVDRVPSLLRSITGWVVWDLTQVPGERKPRKIPSYTNGVRRTANGSAQDRALLATFDQAVAACKAGNHSGIGFALLPEFGVVALDMDDCVVDGRVDPRVLDIIRGTYAEYSPSGRGVRAFYKGRMRSGKSLDIEPRCEIFGDSGYVTVTGNVLPEHDLIGWDEAIDLTPQVQELFADRFRSQSRDLDIFATLKPKLDLTDEQVVEALDRLPADLDYDSWVKVGMAVHHQTGDFDIWHDWSRKSPKYTTRAYCEARWRSFGNYSGEAITFAWVLKLTGVAVQRKAIAAGKSHQQRIAECTDVFILRTEVAEAIRRDTTLQSIDRAVLADALKVRFTTLGMKLPISEVRKLLAVRAEHTSGAPEWAESWVYVTDDCRFLHLPSGERIKREAFDARFNRHMPRDDQGSVRQSASEACLEDWGMPAVSHAAYMPQAGPLFEHDGLTFANTYRPRSVPTAAESSGGIEVPLVDHLRRICGGRQDVFWALLQWLGWNVQNPGVKVRWAPLIKGIEGDGKTLIGELLGSTMGHCNVRTISPQLLHTDFTGWAEGACVGVLEEIKLTGHSRHDVHNKLKPYITNDKIDVHRKGLDAFNAPNTQNYIAFTNHADALPLSDNDRRWLVIFTPWSSVEQMGPVDFKRLFDLIHGEPARLRRWLLDVDLTGFEANGRAPLTAEKAEMVALSVSDEEASVREAIEAGGQGIGADVLSSAHLTRAIQWAGQAVPRTRTLNRLLSTLGWRQGDRIKWRGEMVRIWTRGEQPSPDQVRARLDATAPDAEELGDQGGRSSVLSLVLSPCASP